MTRSNTNQLRMSVIVAYNDLWELVLNAPLFRVMAAAASINLHPHTDMSNGTASIFTMAAVSSYIKAGTF